MQLRNALRSFLTQYLLFRLYSAQQFRNITGSVRRQPVKNSKDELFQYTSGRWIYHEHLRLTERYLEFDIPALHKAIAAASGHSTSDIISFFKLEEGGFNRLFQVTFNDGNHVIARIPYPSTGPEHYGVASEVATLDYLRLHGITTPKVYAWCSTRENPVGSEYIIMEKLDGSPLGDVWFTMTPKEQHGIMNQIVEWETRLMSLNFPASGSIYYRNDILSEEGIPLPDCSDHEFCIGPIAHYSWWHEERVVLKTDRGSWLSSNDVFRAVGEQELKWVKTYAKPRLPYERLYREIHNICQLARCLGFKTGSSLNRPVIRHPDFQPNNILVSKTNEIIGLIDWQHSAILPLGLAAGMPKHFQNYGDPESEKLLEPQINLPSNYDSLDLPEQDSVRETIRKRLVHFLYAAFTKRLNEEHYDAIFNQSVILHQRLFESAVTEDSLEQDKGLYTAPPFEYPDTVIHDTIRIDAQQREADTAMEQMRNVLGVDVLGWVPNGGYKAAREMARDMKAEMLEAAETRGDVSGVQNHFPFDDFNENS
ncbi:phosphotransferase enzyme family protein [Histoplasma capsulatum H143]|uniref:Phosphotransferase enzyme family protein n=1 Tax=Ajellomyces capsulatus (strain H143) TaxID=544712 RepID=C6H9D4_AJECH|nr:phosphotransferase enzyme family protein [Histoplasma capsulatum H143]